MPLAKDSSNVITLQGLRDVTQAPGAPGEYPTDADVRASLELRGEPVAGAQDIPCLHVAGTSGAAARYVGLVPHTVALTRGAVYTVRVTAIVGGVQRVFVFTDPCL